MRMWMIDVKKLCDRHLVAEHVELHMIAGSLQRKKSFNGFVVSNAFEPKSIRRRHADIVIEMTRRGFVHTSKLPSFSIAYLPEHVKNAKVDVKAAMKWYKTKKHTKFRGK